MKCPVDGKSLNKNLYESNIEVDQCVQCKGIWVDKGELEKIEDVHEKNYTETLKNPGDVALDAYRFAREKNDQRTLLCPKCQKELNEREYGFTSEIMIDVCPTCQGIWLDKNELTELEIFFERLKSKWGFWSGLKRMFK